MKRIITVICFCCTLLACSKEESINAISERVFKFAAEQYKLMDQQLQDDRTPRTYTPQGIFVDADLSWWCSGFYPGTLWYIYEKTGDPEIKVLAEKNTVKLADVDACKSKHDVGFQYWCSYGNGLRIADHQDYLPTIEKAAASLAERYNKTIGCFRSWGEINDTTKFTVIIDNMMNLELMMESARLFNCDSLAEIAITHANTTMKHHYRTDYSCYHVLEYDQQTGLPYSKHTAQGYADESSWARGQAWGLYGYTLMYRECKDEAFLKQAENIAKYLFERLPEDGIPYWDFDCPAIPYTYRDASAGAIMASAFIELAGYVSDKGLAKQCRDMSEKQIRTLASDEYLCSEPGQNGCFLLRHSVGNLAGGLKRNIIEVDAPLTYADYYFIEALMRWEKI